MSFWAWGVLGNLIAFVAILFERVLSTELEKCVQARMKAATCRKNASLSIVELEEKTTNERIRIRGNFHKWNEGVKWIAAIFLLISSILLTGDAIMNEDKNKNLVTVEELTKELSSIINEQRTLNSKVTKLEDHVFHPPSGPGAIAVFTPEHLALLNTIDRRFMNIHTELATIKGLVEQQATRITQLEKAQQQIPRPGS